MILMVQDSGCSARSVVSAALQRWSARRVALAAAALAITTAAAYFTVAAFIPGPRSLGTNPPRCGTGPTMILSAQAVPSAARLPCLTALRSGWHVGGADIASGHARFWLDSDQAGPARSDHHLDRGL